MRVAEWKTMEGGLGRVGLLLTLLLASTGRASAERLPIKTYTTADGLGSSAVSYMMADSHGFLWFCTRDGLSRFDGQQFVTYGTPDGLSVSAITFITETRKGDYWVVGEDGNLFRFDPYASSNRAARGGEVKKLFTRYPVNDGDVNHGVTVLYEDHTRRLWAGTSGGLFYLDESDASGTFRRVETPISLGAKALNIFTMLEDREGSLWMGSLNGLLRRLPDGRVTHYRIKPSSSKEDNVNSLLQDADGRLWVGRYDGLLVFIPESPAIAGRGDGSSQELLLHLKPQQRINGLANLPSARGEAAWFTAADGLADSWVTSLHQSSDGDIWIASRKGLTEFAGRVFHSFTSVQGLSGVELGTLVEDRDGNLWLASLTGAFKVTLSGFTTFDAADGLGGNEVHSIYEDTAGHLLAVCGEWYLNRFDGTRFTAAQPRLPEGTRRLWLSNVAFIDRAGDWWVLTATDLRRYKKVRRLEDLASRAPTNIYTARDGLAGDGPFRLFEDSRGDIWISTRITGGIGLSRWGRATERIHTFTEADGLPSGMAASAIAEDARGDVWFGFYGGGLARYRDRRFTLFSAESGVPPGTITALHLDQTGRLWIGSSQGGLGHIDDPAADQPLSLTLTTAEGLGSSNVRCITEDLDGRIYAGTVRGVDQFNPETKQFKHYLLADGLPNDFVRVGYRDRHGALWFGTLGGLARFIPAADRSPANPPIFISGLRIIGNKQPLSELGQTAVDVQELSYAQNQLQVDFFSLNFAPGEVRRYQYLLEGAADENWSAPTEHRTITFANLAPGRYRFLVRAVSADGRFSPSPAIVAFTILPPIWRHWWFIASAALLVGLAVYVIDRYRVARLIELERMRTRIATDLHDDIGSSLSQIAILSEVASKHLSGTEVKAATPLARIAHLSRESVDAMSDIVWAINPRSDRLSDLTHRMRHLANEVLWARGIEVRFNAPADDQDKRIDAETRRQVFLVFKEAVNNIVRHARCAEVEIEFRNERSWLVLTMRDDGCGFDPERAREGHGLMSLRRRASALGGELEVVSSLGRGASLTLRIPLGRRGERDAKPSV